MAEVFTSYSIENDKEFERILNKARDSAVDLTIPLNLIRRDFHRSQKAIFQLKGPGQYPDIKPSTKNVKFRDFGFRYPILFRTGRLAESTTNPAHPESISKIEEKRSLFIGTRVPYAAYHQSDRPRSKIPLRKFLFIGPEANAQVVGQTAGRLSRWKNTLEKHVENALKTVNSGK